jgi:hypothetical protein
MIGYSKMNAIVAYEDWQGDLVYMKIHQRPYT